MAEETKEHIVVVQGCLEFGETRRVTAADVSRVVEAIGHVSLPAIGELMDVRLYFTVDGVHSKNPEGIECKRLAVHAQMVMEVPEIPDCAFKC